MIGSSDFRTKYSLADLESAWAAKPLALTRCQGRTILVLANPGREPLDRVLLNSLPRRGYDGSLGSRFWNRLRSASGT